MAVRYNIQKFPIGFVSKALAQDGGKHTYNVTVTEDTPNGVFIGRGAYVELDHYVEAAAGSVTGKIQGKAANGNYYVEIDTCDEDTLFVASDPVIAQEWTNEWQKEENFVNGANTEVRAYQLAHGDMIELNAAALGLSADPASYPVSVTATAYGSSSLAKALN